MIRFICFICLCFVLIISPFSLVLNHSNTVQAASAISYRYTKIINSSDAQIYDIKVTTDSSGDVYLLGTFSGSIVFNGTDNITCTVDSSFSPYDFGEGCGFIAKYNTDGTYAWVKSFSLASNSIASADSITLDSAGNIYVTGKFFGTIKYNGTDSATCINDSNNLLEDDPMDELMSECGFIAKYNADGTYAWSKSMNLISTENGQIYSEAKSVVTDSSGNVYVTGDFYGTVNFGGDENLTSINNTDAFVVEYKTDGTYVWGNAFNVGSGSYASGTAVSADNLGNIYVTGSLYGTVNFGGSDIYTSGKTGTFVSKFNGDGTYVWTRTILVGDGTSTSVNDAVTDDLGNTYITGSFYGTINFDDNNSLTSGNENIFIAKYNTDGRLVWSIDETTTDLASASGITLDKSGNLFIIGSYCGTLVIGGTNTFDQSENDNDDTFIAEYTTDGSYQIAKDFDSTNGDSNGESIAINSSGYLYGAGTFLGTVVFDGPGGNDSQTSSTDNDDSSGDGFLTSYRIFESEASNYINPIESSSTSNHTDTISTAIINYSTANGTSRPLNTIADKTINTINPMDGSDTSSDNNTNTSTDSFASFYVWIFGLLLLFLILTYSIIRWYLHRQKSQ